MAKKRNEKRKQSDDGPASPADAKKGNVLTTATKVNNRLRETFGDLDDYECTCTVDPATQMTLRQRLADQVNKVEKGIEVSKGKWENQRLKSIYRSQTPLHNLLKPSADVPNQWDEKLFEAALVF